MATRWSSNRSRTCQYRPTDRAPGPRGATPLDQASTSNDNLYFTGNPGQPCNEEAGLGYPDLTDLAGPFQEVATTRAHMTGRSGERVPA